MSKGGTDTRPLNGARSIDNGWHVNLCLMKRQFLHEGRKRQEKAYKPDCGEGTRLKSPSNDHSPDFQKMNARGLESIFNGADGGN
jgi:hypothetical protein